MVWQRIRGFGRDRRGGVLVEAAVIMPLLVFVIMAGMEVARFTLLQQKLNRAAVSTADLVAQAETLTVGELTNIFDAVSYITKPYDFSVRGEVILSSVSKASGSPPTIDWQRSGAGSYSAANRWWAATLRPC